MRLISGVFLCFFIDANALRGATRKLTEAGVTCNLDRLVATNQYVCVVKESKVKFYTFDENCPAVNSLFVEDLVSITITNAVFDEGTQKIECDANGSDSAASLKNQVVCRLDHLSSGANVCLVEEGDGKVTTVYSFAENCPSVSDLVNSADLIRITNAKTKNGDSNLIECDVDDKGSVVYLQEAASAAPSLTPSTVPSSIPSQVPSSVPSQVPSSVPSQVPSSVPSQVASAAPTVAASNYPSPAPTEVASAAPSPSSDN